MFFSLLFVTAVTYAYESLPDPGYPPQGRRPFYLRTDSTQRLIPQKPYLPVQAKTTIPVSQTIEGILNGLPIPALEVNLPLKISNQSAFRYVAIGGSLTAGFRNGGLYRQAQLTSFPNLLARQLGIQNFRQPLFELNQGNGSGYSVVVPGSGLPTFWEVDNELAVLQQYPKTFTRYTGSVDNLGLPGMGPRLAYANDKWANRPEATIGLTYEPSYRAYLRRLLPDDDQQWTTTYYSFLTNQALQGTERANFVTVESGLDDALWYATKGGYRLGAMMGDLAMGEGDLFLNLFATLQENKIKGIVATIPNVLDFPYFSFYTVNALKSRAGGKDLYAVADDGYNAEGGNARKIRKLTPADIVIPSPQIEAVATGKSTQGYSKDNPFLSLDVLDQDEQQAFFRIDELNGLIQTQAERFKVPVVDLKALYKQIIAGSFVADDGVKVDASFPNGNFFSSDGLYPTAFGQAVITNEYIKVINKAYQTRIPLLATRPFANQL